MPDSADGGHPIRTAKPSPAAKAGRCNGRFMPEAAKAIGFCPQERNAACLLAGLAAFAVITSALADGSLQMPAAVPIDAAILIIGTARTSSPATHRRERRKWSFAFPMFAGILALAILAWAVPRLRVSYHLAVGQSAYRLIEEGKTPSPAALSRLRASLEQALALWPTAEAEKRLGLTLLHEATATPADRPERRQLAEEARTHLRRGLTLDPVDPFAWYHLSLAEIFRGRVRESATALAMSWRTGAWHPPLAERRVRVALLVWEALPESSIAAATRELCLARRREGPALDAYARSIGRAELLYRLLSARACWTPERSGDQPFT